MALPTTLTGKTRKGILTIFGYVASEGSAVPDHEKRLAVCKQFLMGSGVCYIFLVETLSLVDGFDDSTSQSDIENAISAAITNCVAGELV